MARPSKDKNKGGVKPLIETESEQKAREAAQVASEEPVLAKEREDPLQVQPVSEVQAPAQTEELEFNEGEDDVSEPEEKEPVQTGHGIMDSLWAVWNWLGEKHITVNI